MDLNNKHTLASELKLDDIRCKIKNVNSDGEVTYITVRNIKGDRRQEILEELSETIGDEEPNLDTFQLFYMSLIIEFTDLVVDTFNIDFLINDTTLTGRMLIQELNDMIYELQYESAMNQLASVRNMALTMISKTTLDEIQFSEERMNNQKRRHNEIKSKNKKVRKVKRKFVK